MSDAEFKDAMQKVAAQHLPPPPSGQSSELIEQLFRRDLWRMRLLAAATLCCWLAAAAGVVLLIIGLNRFVIDVRIHHLLPGATSTATDAGQAAVDDSLLFDATDLLHHSMPFLAGSAAAMMLAALFTVLLVFTSRQATMNRISASLIQIADAIGQIRSGTSADGALPVTTVLPWQNDPRRLQTLPVARTAVVCCIVVVAMLLSTLAFIGLHRAAQSRRSIAWQAAPRLAPFDALRWHGRSPEARVGGQWYGLIAIDGVPVEQILSADPSPSFDLQRKHFGEDLVELMDRLGHPVGATGDLMVRPLPAGDVRVLRSVPMTAADRAAVLEADLNAGVDLLTKDEPGTK